MTARSLAALGMSLVLLLLGISSQSPWLYWMAALVISTLLVSAASAHVQVGKIRLALESPTRATEGEEIVLTLAVENQGSYGRYLILLGDLGPTTPGSPDPVSPRKAFVPRGRAREFLPVRRRKWPFCRKSRLNRDEPSFLLVKSLAAGARTTVSYRRRGLARGIYRSWKFMVYSEGVLGLGKAWRILEVPCLVISRPAFVIPGHLPLLDLRNRFLEEPSPSKPSRGPYYRGVREYVPGDPPRDIHWKAFAHRGFPAVKLYDEEVSPAAAIVIHNGAGEFDPPPLRPGLDVVCRVAASIAASCISQGVLLSLRLTHGEGPASLFPRGMDEVLDWLAGVEPSGVPTADAKPWRGEGSPAFHLFPLQENRGGHREGGKGVPACLVLLSPRGSSPYPVSHDQYRATGGPPSPGRLILEGDDLKKCLEGLGQGF